MADRADGTALPPQEPGDPARPAPTPAETWVTRLPSGTEKQPPIDAVETVAGSSPLPALIRPVQVPGYEVLEELGRGGMGVVYKARQLGLNRLVALKMILAGEHASRDDIGRFRAEAEALAQLHHPHIIQIYQIDEHEGRPFFSMEFVAGGSLAERVKNQPQPPREAAHLAETLARAVHAAHLAGIIHRDLKPANVLIADSRTQSAIPKITDFGLAKRLEDGKGKTRSGDILGTPNYMAPEQAAGRISQIGPATDIHALGAILYELLTGKPPFGKESLLDTLEQVRSHDPEPPCAAVPNVPRDLEVICLKCLRKEPAARYASAEELADDLRRFLDGEPIRARPQTKLERFGKLLRRYPLRIAGALGFIVLLVLFVLLAPSLFAPKPREDGGEGPLRDYSEAEVRRKASQARRGLFERIYKDRTPEGWVRNDLSRDDNLEHEPWSHAQALCALLRCPEAKPEECKELLGGIELLRTKVQRITNDGIPYGWHARLGMAYPQAEPVFWAANLLAAALARPGLLEGNARKPYEAFLSETHSILKTYAPAAADGGWNPVARLRNPRLHNTYVNVLALLVLLETRKDGLVWEGSPIRHEQLIKQTAGWLVRTFDPKGDPPGWYKDNGSKDRILDGLTLQAYSVLLRAASETGFALPEEFAESCREHLLGCGKRTMGSPDRSAYVSYPFVLYDGKDFQMMQNLTYLWYPWAVDACSSWLDHARKRGTSEDKVREVRRVLGHLVVELGEQAVTTGEAFVYIPAERLYGLTAVR